MSDQSRGERPEVRRTRTGCHTCRRRKVKCDELKPECTQCQRGRRECSWQGPPEVQRVRSPRRPNATACSACRSKKLKCVGDVSDACTRCKRLGLRCMRSQRGGASDVDVSLDDDLAASAAAVETLPHTFRATPQLASSTNSESTPPIIDGPSASSGLLQQSTGQLRLPAGEELQRLVDMYFSSVHHFGYFAFIHQLRFNRLLARRKAPKELTLIMIANTMRFAAEPTRENLARADAWADEAIGAVRSRIHQGFGAVQLMTLLLAQHYDLNRGNFTSAWLLGAECTRMMQMMSLHTFDRTYPVDLSTNARLSPLLTREALRRIAWSTFYIDTIVDGGRYGFHVVDENAYRIQLPCDEMRFLSNDTTAESATYKAPQPSDRATGAIEGAHLGMSAFLLRTAAARRRALHFAFRASHKEKGVDELSLDLKALEDDVKAVIASLPARFFFNADNMFLHRDQLTTFILLHIIRHNLFIVVGRAALQIYQRDSTKGHLIPPVRHDRISHALPIAGLMSEGLKAGIAFDPQFGVHAYVALEILLFEPRRLADGDSSIDPQSPVFMEAIPHLLTAIRNIAKRSEFVKQLHVEAVHRLLRCDCVHLLSQTDLDEFLSEYRPVGQDVAEYDFRDFRWARLERLRRGATLPTNVALDETLLHYETGAETAVPSVVPSPRLAALDVNHTIGHMSSTRSPSGLSATAPQSQGSLDPSTIRQADVEMPCWELEDSDGAFQTIPVDWPGLLGESEHPHQQTGDPTMFWNQL